VPGPAFARREGHLIGYARVSTAGQNTTTQEAKFQAGGCTLIRTETVSGALGIFATSLRASVLDFIRPGDVLIVVKLDRLGRNMRDVLNLVHEFEEKGASLRVLEPAIDTGGPMGRMILTVLGIVAEMELSFIRNRQRAGMDAAKAKGVYNGRHATRSVLWRCNQSARMSTAHQPSTLPSRGTLTRKQIGSRYVLVGVGGGPEHSRRHGRGACASRRRQPSRTKVMLSGWRTRLIRPNA
jgi:DNA invertase Pin-like site-specific DNA recombinase